MEKYAEELEALNIRIKDSQTAATQFNAREAILGQPASDYTLLKGVADTFDPFYQFWTNADRFASHMESSNLRRFVCCLMFCV